MKLLEALKWLGVTNNGPTPYKYRLVDHDQSGRYFCGNSGETVTIHPRLGVLRLHDSTGVVHEIKLNTKVEITQRMGKTGVIFVHRNKNVFLSF